MAQRPGTVSKILWHFTGGGKQIGDDPSERSELKPVNEAVDILYKIMQGTVLKASSQPDMFKVTNLRFKTQVRDGRKGLLSYYEQSKKETSRVVCLAEIPIQHLHFHASRYGKVAIGFHRQAVFDSGFNPVAYISDHSEVAKSISNIHSVIGQLAEDPLVALGLEQSFGSHEQRAKIKFGAANCAEFLLDQLVKVMANVKSFSEIEFDTVYCEREWRATHDFHFYTDAVAMIVLPKVGGYLDQFIKDHPQIPRHIPIVSWEDLIEH